MSITVYTTPACVQCNATKKHLDRRGLEYEVVDLSTNPAVLQALLEEGYSQAPIVRHGDKTWSGYRPADIDAI